MDIKIFQKGWQQSMVNNKEFAEFNRHIIKEMKRLKVPGVAVGVLHGGKEFYSGFGITSVENPLPVTPDTLFQVGSISKTFTGTLLMHLVQEGKLDLDAPVRKYIKDLTLSDPKVASRVTTRHLLTHTGGWVGDYFNDFGNGDDALGKMVKSIARLPQITPLGEVFSYNNAGFNIASRLIEVITKKPYENAAQEMLLDPMGLDRTYFYPSDILFTHRFVVGHGIEHGKVKVLRPWAIGRAGNGVGGVVSTVKDLLKYASFHMNSEKRPSGKKILSVNGRKAMRIPQAEAGGRGKIGITWFIRNIGDYTVYSHGGATHGQQAGFFFIPSEGFALAVLTNSKEGGTITDNAIRWAMEIFFKTSVNDPSPFKKANYELAEFEGLYELPLSVFTLNSKNGYLILKDIPRGGFPTPETPPGPASPPVRLAFYDADKVVCIDEPKKNALGDFLRNKNGKVAFLRIGGRAHPRK
jgi:CubicO group peptidase (beta-lactamase class C family)